MTHDVRGHFPYQQYQHPTDHDHEALDAPWSDANGDEIERGAPDLVTPPEPRPRKHFFISNGAFSRMTGVSKVCMDCGAADPPRNSVCPGKVRP